MATIYRITTGAQSLILDPREGLVYPFNFGTGWKEVQLGLFYNYVSISGNNLAPISESINSSDLRSRFTVGFTTKDNALPLSDGNRFFGITNTGMGDNAIAGSSIIASSVNSQIVMDGFNNALVLINSNNTSLLKSARFFDGIGAVFPGTGSITGTECGFIGIKFGIDGNYFSGSISKDSSAFNADQTFLRQKMTQNPNGTVPITGFYTSNGTSTGTIMPKPDAIVVYSPFYLNKIRIQNILVQVTR